MRALRAIGTYLRRNPEIPAFWIGTACLVNGARLLYPPLAWVITGVAVLVVAAGLARERRRGG